MNIMKTNMLVLDNKRIMKDEADNGVVAQGTVVEADDSQKGMNALTFQGLNNVIGNPQLSSKLGNVAKTAKEGFTKNSSKVLTTGAMLISTLLPASMLTSCDKVDVKSSQEQDIKIDIDAIMALVEKLYEANLLTLEELKQMRADINAWQANQNAYNDAVLAILTQMGSNVIDIKNGVQENNAYQQVIIAMLEQQGYSHAQAISLLQTAINLVTQQGKSIEEAMQYIIGQLKDVNQKLDTIIDNQNKAYDQRAEQIEILKGINKNTAETRDAVVVANTKLDEAINTMIDCNNKVVSSINQLDGDLKAGISTIAQTVGWSTSQVIAFMNKLGIDIRNSNAWNASMIIAAINYNTQVQKETKAEIAALREDFNAGRIEAKEYAEKMLEAVDNVNKQIGILIKDVNKYGKTLSAQANAAIAELRMGNVNAARANYLITLVLKEAQKQNGLTEILIQKADEINTNVVKTKEELCEQLGIEMSDLKQLIMWQGFTEAQFNAMNTAAIVNAIKTTGNKVTNTISIQLQAILDKISSGTISQEDIDTIISLLQSIDTNVQAIKTTVDKIYDLLQEESKKNDVFRVQMLVNGRINTQIAMSNNRLLRENNKTLNNMEGYLADLNTKVDSLITLGNQKPDELKAEIARLRQENSAWLAKIDIDQNMGTAAIIAKLRDFQNTYVRTEREEIKLQKKQNNMLNYAISLLKNPSKDNTAVLNALQEVINAINSGKEDITAELQKANSTLNALLEKVGLILDEMGKLISTVKVYGDQIINKFGTNEKILEELKAHGNLLRDANGKLDLNNLTLAQLKAEVEKIKPELQKLNTAANTANSYLDIISKKQVEIDQHIQNIDNGNGITAEELDSLWNMHDANAFAKAKAYMDALHIDDMTKADEIIALMKKGNETNNNIYIKLSDFANKTDLTAEQLRALLKAVYDYLPELKCNCNCKGDCDNNKSHEGIIGDLIS